MYEKQSQITAIIIAVVIILVILGVFILVVLSYFNNRKLKSMQEKESMKREFEETLLKTQLEVQEETMRQISQEIHDNVGQILSLVNLNLKTLKTNDTEKIDNTCVLVNKAITDLRSLSKSLNPENLERVGLTELMRKELDQLQKTGFFITNLEVEDEIQIPSGKLIILYRMLQEVLNNVIKHSEATKVDVAIKSDQIIITDNGKGFNTNNKPSGLGLQNLVQRAKVIGATVNVESVHDKGTIVIFSFNNQQ